MKYPSLLFTADSGGTPTGGASPVVPPGAAPTAPAPATPDPSAVSSPPASTKTFTQAELDQIIADRLDRQKRSLDSAADKQRTAAEQAALAEQGQFKTLAEQHAARIAELEPKAQQVERYEKALDAQLATLKADLPDYVLTLLESQDKAAQLEWLAANRAKLVAAPAPSTPPAVPAPNTNAAGGRAPVVPDAEALKKREEELKQRFRIG